VNQPLISVVTPFHNTAPYLAECIESVLQQSYHNYEYILVDNCSSDDSPSIAESYARRDSRIRFIRRSNLLSQVQNYNAALEEISIESEYCKIVQADDCIFPECLQSMVQAFGQSETIGLVGSYWLKGDAVRGSGFPHYATWLSGRELASLYLRSGIYMFGSPTTVMYRSSVVRNETPFFDETLLHEDTEKCMQLLERWDFGFVPQILSFLRLENESISFSVRSLLPQILDWYMITQRYAPVFLERSEASAIQKSSKQEYYKALAHQALRFRKDIFWQYHKMGLRSLGQTLDWPYLAGQVAMELFWKVANPGATVRNVVDRLSRASDTQKKIDSIDCLRKPSSNGIKVK